jgi:hypothetical protein
MQNLPDEIYVEELGYLFFYSLAPFIIKLPQALLDWLGVGPDPQRMLSDLPRDSRHV